MSLHGSVPVDTFRQLGRNMKAYENNLANSHTPGYFRTQVLHQELSCNTQGVGVTADFSLMSEDQASLKSTDRRGDLAILKPGSMFITKGSDSDRFQYLRTGGFHINKDSFLESGGFVLQGYKINDGKMDQRLVPIEIRKDEISKPEPTMNLYAKMNLNSDTAADGQVPLTLSALQAGSSSQKGKTMTLVHVKEGQRDVSYFTFDGFVESDLVDASSTLANAIAEGTPLLTITEEMSSNGAISNTSYTIKAKTTIAAGTTYEVALNMIAEDILAGSNKACGAEVRKNKDGKVSLVVYSSPATDHKTLKLSVNTSISALVVFRETVIPPNSGDSESGGRFASVDQLRALLQKRRYNVRVDEFLSLQLVGGANESFAISSGDGRDDQGLLELFDAAPRSTAPLYSYSDSEYSMSGGNAKADHMQEVTVYDQKGNPHRMILAAKKLSDSSWAAELYTHEVLGGRESDKSVIQAGVLNFDQSGRLVSIRPLGTLSSEKFFDQSADLLLPEESQLKIGGHTFSYGDGDGKFRSMKELARAINQFQAETKCAATIVARGTHQTLVLTPSTSDPIVINGEAEVLEATKLGRQRHVPLIGSGVASFEWVNGLGGATPTQIDFQLNIGDTRELSNIANQFEMKADGNAAGEYVDWYISPEGMLNVTYSNNARNAETYVVPIAMFKAPQHLVREAGAYVESGASGPAIIRKPDRVTGLIYDKALVDSGADASVELMNIVENQHFSQLAVSAMQKSFQLLESFINKI